MATIKQQYKKARKNYLARVNRLVKQGYIVDVIPIPKNPTKHSINRLTKMTGKKIASMSTLVDMLSGEVLYASSTGRKSVVKQNRQYLKLSPFEQEVARSIQNVSKEIINNSIQKRSSTSIPNNIDIIIENWYDTISQFRGDIRELVTDRTNELLSSGKNDREKFAYTFINNPNLLPQVSMYDEKVINAYFNEFKQAMDWNSSTEDFQRFMDSFGIIESEG